MSSVRNLTALKEPPALKRLDLCLVDGTRQELDAIRRARRDMEVRNHDGCRATKFNLRVTPSGIQQLPAEP